MDCTDCGPERADRPHLFFAHRPDACPGCNEAIEARVVIRDDKVFALTFCKACGQREQLVDEDAKTFKQDFLAGGVVPAGHEGDWKFKDTTSTCPTCLELVPADVVIRAGQVFFKKTCTRCGPSEAMVSEDADYYVKAYDFARPGTEPHVFRHEVEHGCPTDCGTCGDHEQHTCLPIVEVTDHCNLECPICIVDNQYSNHMPVEEFAKICDRLVEAEGACESIAISGGEPTSHPEILELIRVASRPEIGRVVVVTNGIRLGKDRKFAEALKALDCYVGLQLDGFDASVHEDMRGRDLTKEKEAALTALRELQIPTQMIFVATKGVNDHQIGQAVDLLMTEDHILSLNFQPVAFTGHGGGQYAHDPMSRLTIPGVIQRVEAQTEGRVKKADFSPLPCSHPQCTSLTYLLKLNDGSYVPFSRFADFEKNGDLLRSSATLPSSDEVHRAMHEIIHDVYANEDEIDQGTEILAALRRSLDVMFPDRTLTTKEATRIGEGQAKSIFVHHYMDRHDFDLERLRKCCHHYPQTDGKVMPACGFNMFHRGAAKGPETAVPEWGLNHPEGAGTGSAKLLRVLQ